MCQPLPRYALASFLGFERERERHLSNTAYVKRGDRQVGNHPNEDKECQTIGRNVDGEVARIAAKDHLEKAG